MAEYWDLEDWVEQIAVMPIKYFYPTLPTKDLQIDVSEVIKGLVQLVERGWLELLWEVRCPECFSTSLPMRECPREGDELECERCFALFEADDQVVYPVFSVTSEFKVRALKKTIKATSNHSRQQAIATQRGSRSSCSNTYVCSVDTCSVCT